ncbi:MAG: hypothetical protein ACOYJR_07610 [Acutalibacteraceae bacterium]|jgi:hypothetical protein
MKAGIALIGDGIGAAGVWQAMCALHLSHLPLLAVDDTALPLLCKLLCRKYKISPRRQKRMERGGAAAQLELLRFVRWLRNHTTSEPLKPGALLFFFSGGPLLLCAPGTDVFLAGGKKVCSNDCELLLCVMRASRMAKNEPAARVWPLSAAGAEKTVVFLLNSQHSHSGAGESFQVFFERKGMRAAENVFCRLWQRRSELYDALLF